MQKEDQGLLSLFKKRVELKKELARFRAERERLADQLKQQENATYKSSTEAGAVGRPNGRSRMRWQCDRFPSASGGKTAVGDAEYGNLRDCRKLSRKIDLRVKALEESADMPARVQTRANYLKDHIEYRRDTDAVPGDLAQMLRSLANGSPVGEVNVNILAEEF